MEVLMNTVPKPAPVTHPDEEKHNKKERKKKKKQISQT